MYLRTLKLRIKQRLLRNVRESSQAFEHKIISQFLASYRVLYSAGIGVSCYGRYWGDTFQPTQNSLES